jgi:NhaA family Na+:H+ antiporter
LVLWALVLKSGVHATLAGVAVAMAVPLRIGKGGGGDSRSPLVSLEHDLHHVVVFIILPVFAFANAGVNFSAVSLADLAQPIPLGIAAGLLLGKSVGITAAVWAATKTGVAPLPAGCSWPAMFGIACLCGIGFTVSLFIGNLAFGVDETTINLVKLGVLTGSTVAGVVGFCALRAALPKRAAAA